MLRGFVDRLVVGDRRYVIQTEDKGPAKGQFAISVFEGGVLVHQRAVSYADLLELELADQDELIASAMRSTHNRVLKDLEEGSFPRWPQGQDK